MGDQSCFYQVEEVPIQSSIEEEEHHFLYAIPNLINGDESRRDLEACWNPDAKDGDVNEKHNGSDSPFQPDGFLRIHHDEGGAVDDNLEDQLGLNCPGAD